MAPGDSGEIRRAPMDVLTWFLLALPVAGMVLLAGCGL